MTAPRFPRLECPECGTVVDMREATSGEAEAPVYEAGRAFDGTISVLTAQHTKNVTLPCGCEVVVIR